MGTPRDQALGDIAACRDFLKPARARCCIVGYCYGGSWPGWRPAASRACRAGSSYYGSLVSGRHGRR